MERAANPIAAHEPLHRWAYKDVLAEPPLPDVAETQLLLPMSGTARSSFAPTLTGWRSAIMFASITVHRLAHGQGLRYYNQGLWAGIPEA